MKVVCCECGNLYEYEYDKGTILRTIDIGFGNIMHIIQCPHCGLRHTVYWSKYGWEKFPK